MCGAVVHGIENNRNSMDESRETCSTTAEYFVIRYERRPLSTSIRRQTRDIEIDIFAKMIFS